MKRGVLPGILVLGLLLASVPADACVLCLGGLRLAPGLQLDVADQAVIAVPVALAPSQK